MRIYDPVAVAANLSSFEFVQELAPFNASSFGMYRADAADASAWELHPDTDELLMVLRGEVTVEILTATYRHQLALSAGQFTVVPKGHWHRHIRARDVVEMFYTPGASVNSDADDPRIISTAAAATDSGAAPTTIDRNN
ncbi:cupin domain-containing protein [Nocardia sp. NBC_01503]|uniref:cupin domain-containing protein n=1 Tax=Nocardia sp. NBC_01503 TaxID=2975997 RepID=UPI002E7B62B8|nr:cupin domain-containing protein [Nocardia sp. NBC_01503]WTL31450.1 cupin domain-containing protein [Nocardia sp. NBC_01503]